MSPAVFNCRDNGSGGSGGSRITTKYKFWASGRRVSLQRLGVGGRFNNTAEAAKVRARQFLPPFSPVAPGGHGAAGESADTCVSRWSCHLIAAAGNGHVEQSNGSASRRRRRSVKWGQLVRVSRCWLGAECAGQRAERGSPRSGCRCSMEHFVTGLHYVITCFIYFFLVVFLPSEPVWTAVPHLRSCCTEDVRKSTWSSRLQAASACKWIVYYVVLNSYLC